MTTGGGRARTGERWPGRTQAHEGAPRTAGSVPMVDGQLDDSLPSVTSSIAVPALTCPKCEGLLPHGLGELQCQLCMARVKVDHPGVRREWREEKVQCPSCHQLLLAGVETRPATLECGSCHQRFDLVPPARKVEIDCPACAQRLRVKQQPGQRELTCPACSTAFRVTF